MHLSVSVVYADDLQCNDGTTVPQPAPYPGYSVDFCEDKNGVDSTGAANIGTLGSADDLGIPDVEADQNALNRVLNIVFVITGALATVFIIIGGIKFVFTAGSPDGVKSARNTILYAVVGLLVSVLAYTIVNFVINNL
ncbi:MAG: pilin [Candidatus Saccharimonadales bacterium]